MNNNELRAAILNRLRLIHYISAEDYGNETVDTCHECAVEWPCRTVLTLNGDLDA